MQYYTIHIHMVTRMPHTARCLRSFEYKPTTKTEFNMNQRYNKRK